MHHQMGVGQPCVDFLDPRDRQDVAGGLARKLVGAMAGADRNRQGIDLRAPHEVGSLLRVGEQLLAGHGGVGAMAVFLVALHGFE